MCVCFCMQVCMYAAAAAKSLQSCPTLCDPMDCSPPGFSIHGILQARTLEWVAISFPNAWKWKEKVKSLSCVWLLATPWTAAHQAPPSVGFSRQQYWSGVPLPSPVCMYIFPQSSNHDVCSFIFWIALNFMFYKSWIFTSSCHRWCSNSVMLKFYMKADDLIGYIQ